MADCKSEFVIKWKIENFSMLPHQKGYALDSPKFVFDTEKSAEWRLELYPRGDAALHSNGHMSLFLRQFAGVGESKVSFAFSIEPSISSKEKIVGGKGLSRVLSEGHSWGLPKFFSLETLFEQKNIYLPNDVLTLNAYLRPGEDSTKNSKEVEMKDQSDSSESFLRKNCSFRTSIKVHSRKSTWSINDINEQKLKRKKVFFQVASVLKDSPSLSLSLNFGELEKNDYVPIEIHQTCLEKKKGRLFVKCKLTVMGADRNYNDSEESTYLFSLDLKDAWNFPLFLKSCNFVHDKYSYLDDMLILHCDIAFSYKSDVYEINHMPLPIIKESGKRSILSTSIENLYKTKSFCDVSLVAGGESVPAFKIVLCARSSVFRAMFMKRTRNKKKNTNVVEISDVDPATLKRMLTFMHTDVLKEELSHEDVCKLYRAADKYDVDYLKRFCNILMVSAMSVENICDALTLADALNDHFLMAYVHNFIYSNAAETFRSPNWNSFMEKDPKFAMKIMHQYIKEQRFNN